MSEFTAFLMWHDTRYQRAHGKPLAASTLRSKAAHLPRACRAASVNCSATELAFVLADRDATDAMLDRLSAQCSPVYVRCLSFTIIQFGEWAKLTYGTSCTLKLRDVPNPVYVPQVDCYQDDEVARLLIGARVYGLRHYLFVLMLMETGRRLNEVLGIRYEDLRLDLNVPHLILNTTKGGNPQPIPLSPALVAALTPETLAALKVERTRRPTRNSPDEYLFCWTDHAARDAFRTLCASLSVPYRRVHGTRHTWATNKLSAGVPLHAVSKLLGHGNTVITQRVYDHTVALDFARYLD